MSDPTTRLTPYEAGYDCGKNGANLKNCHFSLFATPQMTRQWELDALIHTLRETQRLAGELCDVAESLTPFETGYKGLRAIELTPKQAKTLLATRKALRAVLSKETR